MRAGELNKPVGFLVSSPYDLNARLHPANSNKILFPLSANLSLAPDKYCITNQEIILS